MDLVYHYKWKHCNELRTSYNHVEQCALRLARLTAMVVSIITL